MQPRIAWPLALACLGSVVGYPTWFLLVVDELEIRPSLVDNHWRVEDLQTLVLLVAALLIPAAIHRWQLARLAPGYQVARSAKPGPGYRGAPPLVSTIRPESVRRRAGLYGLRLGLAIGLCYVPILGLMNTRFIENRGCMLYEVRSVPQHTLVASLVLVVLVLQAPTKVRMLGAKPAPDGDGLRAAC